MNKSVWIEGNRVRWYEETGEINPFTKKPVVRKMGKYIEDHNFRQKFAAEKKLSLLARRDGIVDPTLTPSVCFEKYVVYMESNPDEFRPSTIQMKKESLEDYLKTILKMEGLSPKHFSEYLSKRHYGVTTKSIRLRQLRAFCYWCLSEGYLDKNPFLMKSADGKQTKFKIHKGREAGRKLEIDEVNAMLKVMNPRGLLYALFISSEGSRRTETTLVDWSHIDLKEGTWTIPADNDKTKTGRTIPLDDIVVEHLLAVPEAERHGPVFKGFNKKTGWWYVRDAAKKAGIKPQTYVRMGKTFEKWPSPHDFRHSFVSHWEKDPRIVMEQVGWRSLDMLKRYSHFNMRQLRDALKSTGVGSKISGANLGQNAYPTHKSIHSDEMSHNSIKNVKNLLPPSENP